MRTVMQMKRAFAREIFTCRDLNMCVGYGVFTNGGCCRVVTISHSDCYAVVA